MPYDKKQMDYINQYKRDHLKRIALEVPKDTFEIIHAHALKRGESVNGFIKRAITETMERDNTPPNATQCP